MRLFKNRSLWTFRKDIVATILVAILTFTSGTAFLPKTPRGIQCPNHVSCEVHSKKFHQCECAERASSGATQKSGISFTAEFPIPVDFSSLGTKLERGWSVMEIREEMPSLRNPSPATPPPDLAS